MVKITFLKKDELALRIYKTIWKNKQLWYLPHKKELGGHFQGLHVAKQIYEMFIYEGNLYTDNYKLLINIPEEEPLFTEEEINSTIKIERVDFERKKGEGKFLTKENFLKRFELLNIE